MQPINICNVKGEAVAANTMTKVLSQGTYDLYAKDLAVIRVGLKSKLGDFTTDNGYTIPAGSVITMVIDRDNMCMYTNAKVILNKVG